MGIDFISLFAKYNPMRLFPKLICDPSTDPDRRELSPTGFPKRRTKPAPPLSQRQAHYAAGYSLFSESWSNSLWNTLGQFRFPLLVLPLNAIGISIFTLCLYALTIWLYWYFGFHVIKGASEIDMNAKSYALFGGLALLSIIFLAYRFLTARQCRLQRWHSYEWASFSEFAASEAWMAYIGFVEVLCLIAFLGLWMIPILFFR
jgi:hypothetical protein